MASEQTDQDSSTQPLALDPLDAILACQLTVAWAGERLSEPPRLGWWRTDLIDEAGGGDLFRRLFPKTHRWASLEALRKVAIRADRTARQGLAAPDQVRSLFFWGFAVDEKLEERLLFHKRTSAALPDALPLPLELGKAFVMQEFERAISIPNVRVDFKVVPGGELTGGVPNALELQAQRFMAALLPLAERYPMPFCRVNAMAEQNATSKHPGAHAELAEAELLQRCSPEHVREATYLFPDLLR